jgi:hypothetical protein
VRVVKYSPHIYQVREDELEQWIAARRAERE